MEQYAVLHLEKCNTVTKGLGQHIDRHRTPPNADPLKSHLNEHLIRPLSNNLVSDVNYRIAEGYKGKTAIRKDAVRAYRIILSGSHERMKEIEQDKTLLEQWKNANVAFLSQRFGADNLIRVTLHMDETTPHIHAIVVPITSDGRLSAKSILDGPKALKQLQSDYARAMQIFGLTRGRDNSTSKHTDISEYYGRVNSQSDPFRIDIPKHKAFERPDNYIKRVRLSLAPLQETLVRAKRTIAELKHVNHQVMQENLKLIQQNQIAHAYKEGNKMLMQQQESLIARAKEEGMKEGIERGQEIAIGLANKALAPMMLKIELNHERMQLQLTPFDENEKQEHKTQKKDFGMHF